jgi:hypothetical protein
MFFFEKKNQKTFVCWVTRTRTINPSGDQGAGGKFFGSFFQKRTLPFAWLQGIGGMKPTL